MIESISTRDLADRLGFPRYSIRRNRPFSTYNVGERLRTPLKEVDNYEEELLKKIVTKYKNRGIDFRFDTKDLYPLLVSGKEVREKWNISNSTQSFWVTEEKTGRYPTTTKIGKSRYFVRVEVDFIEKGLAGKWRSRASEHAEAERIL